MSDKNNNNPNDNKNQDNYSYVEFGLMGGCLFAIIIGLIRGSLSPMAITLGSGLGMLLGVVIGTVMDENKKMNVMTYKFKTHIYIKFIIIKFSKL